MGGKLFELEQVLGYRREMERIRKQELATARLGLDQAHQKLRREEQLVERLSDKFNQSQQEIGCIDDLRMYSDFFARKREEIKLQKERVEHLNRILDEKRFDLMVASKDKKVLESLKDRKAKEFIKESATKEQKFLDEISIQKKVELK